MNKMNFKIQNFDYYQVFVLKEKVKEIFMAESELLKVRKLLKELFKDKRIKNDQTNGSTKQINPGRRRGRILKEYYS